MIKINNDIKVWITSDTHYAHKNICRGVTNWRMPDGSIPEKQTRPFETIEKMNAAIVNNINEVVGQDDILIHLGDWSFGGFENIEEFYHRLICKNIHLILGNHDHHIDRNRGNVRDLFKSVSWFDQFEYQGETYLNDINQMIAYFTYFEYKQDSQSYDTPTGENSSDSEIGTKVNPLGKLVQAYNAGIELYNNAIMYLEDTNAMPIRLSPINSYGI